MRPDNSLRLLPKGETDNEGRHALHPILRVLQILQVLSPIVAISPGLESLFGDLIVVATVASI